MYNLHTKKVAHLKRYVARLIKLYKRLESNEKLLYNMNLGTDSINELYHLIDGTSWVIANKESKPYKGIEW